MGIKGKQILNDTISQDNMYIQTNTILSGSSVTNKEYVNQQVNQKVSGIHQSALNQHMTANIATVGEHACYDAVIEFPTSSVLVKVNGTIVNVGSGLDCYFSPDGIIIRSGGNAQKGDYLYWNSNKYDLNTNDEIDFNYLTGYDYVTLNSGTTITLDPFYNSMVVKYVGETGTTMTVIISGISFIVGNSGGSFVWDIGGLDEHTFTTSNESIVVTINGENYTIWWDGFGSLVFSVKKGGEIPGPSSSIKYGMLYNWFTITDSRNISNTGWKVPTNDDYTTLVNYLGGESTAGGKMKETGFVYWNSPNVGADNSSKFNGRGGGARWDDGLFYSINENGYFGTTSEYSTTNSLVVTLNYSDSSCNITWNDYSKLLGSSVRLLKITTTLSDGQTGTYIGNDGTSYRTICIGTQEWLADNLMETKYRNSDTIPEVINTEDWTLLSTGAYCAYNNDHNNIPL